MKSPALARGACPHIRGTRSSARPGDSYLSSIILLERGSRRCVRDVTSGAFRHCLSARCLWRQLPAISGMRPRPPPRPPGPLPKRPKNEIPAAELERGDEAHFQGAGLMEQYEYGKAAEAFREVPRAPRLDPRLDQPGDRPAEHDRASRSSRPRQSGGERTRWATSTKPAAPDRRAGSRAGQSHAHFCTGIILEQKGDLSGAHEHFRRVTELDPHDATSWYWAASTLTDPENHSLSTSPKLAKQQAALYSKALELDPYLTQAVYKLSFVSRLAGEPLKQKALLDRWKKINPDRQQPVPGPGNSAAKVYGEMGKYATVIGPLPRPVAVADVSAIPPRFEPAKPAGREARRRRPLGHGRGLQGGPGRHRQGSRPLRSGRRHVRRQR